MEQYRSGEYFVEQVVNQRGIGFMNQVWESAANLPTLREIYDPLSWLARMDR